MVEQTAIFSPIKPRIERADFAIFTAGSKSHPSYSGTERAPLFVNLQSIGFGYGAVFAPHELQSHLRFLTCAWWEEPAGTLPLNHAVLRRIAGRAVTPHMLHGFIKTDEYYHHHELYKLYCATQRRTATGPRKQQSKRKRFSILERDGFRCVYCGRGASVVELCVDHVKPVSRGGTNAPENTVTSCVDCNAGKADRLINTNHVNVEQ